MEINSKETEIEQKYDGFKIQGKCIHGNDFELHKLSEIISNNIITRVILDLIYDYWIDESIPKDNGKYIEAYTADMNFRYILSTTPSNQSWETLRQHTIQQGKDKSFRFVAIGFDIQRVWLNFTLFQRNQIVFIKNIKTIINYLPREDMNPITNNPEIMQINPIFRVRSFKRRERSCFLLMPFSAEWSNRVLNHLKKIVSECNLQCIRADDLYGNNIIEDIWRAINEVDVIIADTTDKNPNVFYEIGIAHTLGKKLILITQDENSIPFDFRILRHIIYSDNIDGFAILERELPRYISYIMASSP